MSVRYHRVSRALFDAIAAGGGGAEAVRVLAAAQYSKHMLLLRGVLDAAQAAGHGQKSAARRGYELLAAAQRHDPARAAAVIGYSSVGAWAMRTLRALRGGAAVPGAAPAGLCAVAAAAAIRAGLPAEIEAPATGGAVVLPSLGAAAVDGEGAVVRNAAGGVDVVSAGGRVAVPADPYRDAPGWSGLHRAHTGSLDVLIDDLDPFRMPAAPHVAPRLPAAKAAMWEAAFQQAWPLLERHHPAVAAEVAAAVRVVVPLVVPPHGVASSSSPETFGAIALSEPSDRSLLAVTLAHEVQHLKLSALLDIVTLTRPDDGRRFYAPWRDDPRPVSGLLQGAYAYLGVSGFWRRQRHLEDGDAGVRAHADFARWRAAAARVTDTLKSSGCLTPAGLEFVQGMARTLSSWKAEPVPATALALAQSAAEQHLLRWWSVNGPIPA
jgi:HEXXH motif-containing protein